MKTAGPLARPSEIEMIEIELKFPILPPETLDSVRNRFVASGATAHLVSLQSDEYLNDPLRDFAKQDKALRIRSHDGRYFMTYKGPCLDEVAKIRHEIEMPLESAACADQLKQAFIGIGFVSVATVSKRREKMTIKWQNQVVEICLDEVDEVGSFVEVELVVEDDGDIESAKQTLLSLAEEVGLSGPIKTSYLGLLLDRRGQL